VITIIAGSRICTSYYELLDAIEAVAWSPTKVISGTAQGADQLGEKWALDNNIPLERYPANWDKHGRSAGYKRNVLMAANAQALIALWDGESRGTKHMIDIALKSLLSVFVWKVPKTKTYKTYKTPKGL